ncbi:MAG: tryptophan 7-halogenase, partial [Myxococcales bacterium]|nr:tryptophan 7-halogenase [Myxococcales bacterium]
TFVWGQRKEPWAFRFYRTGPEDGAIAGDADFLHSFQVERSKFDDILLKHAIELGAEVHEGARVTTLEGLDDSLKTVRATLADGSERVVRAPFVVDASGRNSAIRTRFGERHMDPFFKNITVFRYYEGGHRLEGDRAGDALLVAFEHGWFWFIPLANDLLSVGVVLFRDAYDAHRDRDPAALFDEMVAQAPLMAEYLAQATPCRRAPYDEVRVEADYSYIHSHFTHNGVFLAGDAACFIDPLFSSGVHLATYAGYLAATGIDAVLGGATRLEAAAQAYEDAYRREYTAFYRFLVSFYELHDDEKSYFWRAHKVSGEETDVMSLDAFVRTVSGQATTGSTLFASGEDLVRSITTGANSIGTMADKVSGGAVSDEAVTAARDYMGAIHEGRHRIIRGE